MFVERWPEDLDGVEGSLAYVARLRAVVEVADFAEINSHQFGRDTVGGQPIQARHADLVVRGSPARRALAFHAFVAGVFSVAGAGRTARYCQPATQ